MCYTSPTSTSDTKSTRDKVGFEVIFETTPEEDVPNCYPLLNYNDETVTTNQSPQQQHQPQK